MDHMPVSAVIFQAVPESVILFSLAGAILGVRWNLYVIFPASVLSALAAWAVRALPLPYGIHSLIGVVVVTMLIIVFFRVSILRGLIGSLFAFASLAVVQVLIVPILAQAVGVTDLRDMWTDSRFRIILAWPELILMGIVAWLLYRFRPFPEQRTGQSG